MLYDWADRIVWGFVVLISLVIFGSFGWAVYATIEESKKPAFELKKDAWVCTKDHLQTYTTYIMVGKVMVPQVHTNKVCDQYTRT